MKSEVVVVGAGLAGLACAVELHKKGIEVTVCEASDAVGGRARSDHVDGFILDRGFQVLLTAYPDAQALLDYRALELRAFLPGAKIFAEGQFSTLADPWRSPWRAVQTFFSSVGTVGDKARIWRMRREAKTRSVYEQARLFETPDSTTMAFLRRKNFSDKFIERFWRPWLSGIFLESSLETSNHMLEFVFSMFAQGTACLPAKGMGAIAQQLADTLPAGAIKLNSKVHSCTPTRVLLDGDDAIETKQTVIATDASSAMTWLSDLPKPVWRSVACFYFMAPSSPLRGQPWLLLNGDKSRGCINNVCVPSDVQPTYAPSDKALISVSVVLENKGVCPDFETVQSELVSWFGTEARQWVPMRHYVINEALPALQPEVLRQSRYQKIRHAIEPRGWIVCGDHLENPSIQGALRSGRKAAQRTLKALLKPAFTSQSK